jgi:GT2 family glycosyltransferase
MTDSPTDVDTAGLDTADDADIRVSLIVLAGAAEAQARTRASIDAQEMAGVEVLEVGAIPRPESHDDGATHMDEATSDSPEAAMIDTADPDAPSTGTGTGTAASDTDTHPHPHAAPPQAAPPPTAAEAAARAVGRWVGVLGAGDTLEPGALRQMIESADETDGVRVVYADERLPDGRTHAKPSWMPRALDHLDVLGRLTLVRSDLLAEVGSLTSDPAPEWDLHLRIAEHLGAGDPLRPAEQVLHLPFTSVARADDPADSLATGAAAVRASLTRRRVDAAVRPPAVGTRSSAGTALGTASAPDHLSVDRVVADPPTVSVVIPTGGGERDTADGRVRSVEVALSSLVGVTEYPELEIVVVTSEGTDPSVGGACRAIDPRVRVVEVPGAFNFSRSINAGVAASSGELVLLLNDDTEILHADWLSRLVAIGLEDGVGAVGARLLYGDRTIQHAGIAMSADRTPSHLLIREPSGLPRFGVGTADLEFLAVTGACLLTPRSSFEEVGGLSEWLPLSYNDVDYCLKLRAVGLRTVCAGSVRLIHHESVTRDAHVSDREHAAVTWWSAVTALDPWYWGM